LALSKTRKNSQIIAILIFTTAKQTFNRAEKTEKLVPRIQLNST